MKGTWQRLAVGGKPVDVYEPPGTPAPRFGILFLHPVGLETLAPVPAPQGDYRGGEAFTRVFDALKLVCVSPHGGRCWWTDRICSEFDPTVTPERYLLESIVPFFRERWQLAPRAIGLLGISMGGQGALRLAFKYSDLFPVAAGIASAIEYQELYGEGTPLDAMYDSKEQCRQDTALMHVPPFRPPPHVFFCVDPADARWHRGNDRLHEKLNALGVAHTCDLDTQAGGHSWDYFNHMADRAIRFVYAGLEQESRRLL
jgi:S-formylglutathione hydrolase